MKKILPDFPNYRVTKKLEIKTADKLILRGWHMAAKNEVKGNIIIVHGLKDHSERYLDFAEELSKNGYHVYAYDQRGHGRSDGEPAYFPDFEIVTNDLDLAIKSFKRTSTLQKPWIILGHSIGGSIAARYSITHPEALSGFILSAPALKRMPELQGMILGVVLLTNVIAPHTPVISLPNEKFSRDPKVVEEMTKDPLIFNRKISARLCAGTLLNMEYLQENKSKTQVPFLILHGTGDQINNIEGSRDFFEGTPNVPGKQLKIYPVLSHDLLHEPEHLIVEKDILNWINLITSKRREFNINIARV